MVHRVRKVQLFGRQRWICLSWCGHSWNDLSIELQSSLIERLQSPSLVELGINQIMNIPVSLITNFTHLTRLSLAHDIFDMQSSQISLAIFNIQRRQQSQDSCCQCYLCRGCVILPSVDLTMVFYRRSYAPTQVQSNLLRCSTSPSRPHELSCL